MDLNQQILKEIGKRPTRPKAIRLSVEAFQELETKGYIKRGSGGPGGLVDWVENVPWYSKDIYAWCDPSFRGVYELPPA
jgi:hypothetical protein